MNSPNHILRLSAPLAASLLLLIAAPVAGAGQVRGLPSAQADHSSESLIVGFDRSTSAAAGGASIASVPGARAVEPGGPRSAVVRVRPGASLAGTARQLAARPGVNFVKPNYVARISSDWVPNDPGRGTTPGGWQRLQWNLTGRWGLNVLPAWRKLRKLGRPGGRGVVVAVIDTGVAFENHGRYRRSPDLLGVRIKSPYDLIDRDRHPDDRNGHGTHVASTIVERTNNAIGVTGIAYGATLMPVRALSSRGYGNESTVARAIRYAADRGADVINLSVEFDVRLTASDLPVVISAMNYAKRKGALVVAAAGNQEAKRVAYPARSGYALAVGASTASGCRADYSNYGRGLDLVAPGGGEDSFDVDTSPESTDASNCRMTHRPRPIYQMTFAKNVRHFFLPGTYQGTSMAAPHVSATAALVIASRVIGRGPTPSAVQARLEGTARDLGAPGYDARYGSGLVNAAAAVGAD